MCGIAGLIHRGKSSNVGAEMTSRLQALKHRGPDSTGFAVYGAGNDGDYVMRFVLAEQEEMGKGFDMHDAVLTGVETRTSSPLKISRGANYQSLNVQGLYPAGEGASYAGGILSAGVDGIEVAEALLEQGAGDILKALYN